LTKHIGSIYAYVKKAHKQKIMMRTVGQAEKARVTIDNENKTISVCE